MSSADPNGAKVIPDEVRRGLDALMRPLVKHTLYSQPEYPREHILNMLDKDEPPSKLDHSTFKKSPKSRVRSKMLQYRDHEVRPVVCRCHPILAVPYLTSRATRSATRSLRTSRLQVDPLLLPALTQLFAAKGHTQAIKEEEALQLLRDGLLPKRAKKINKRALKKVSGTFLIFSISVCRRVE